MVPCEHGFGPPPFSAMLRALSLLSDSSRNAWPTARRLADPRVPVCCAAIALGRLARILS